MFMKKYATFNFFPFLKYCHFIIMIIFAKNDRDNILVFADIIFLKEE